MESLNSTVVIYDRATVTRFDRMHCWSGSYNSKRALGYLTTHLFIFFRHNVSLGIEPSTTQVGIPSAV